jgi:hypothetical protein
LDSLGIQPNRRLSIAPCLRIVDLGFVLELENWRLA